uniref:RecQ-mediated genome instability protein 1 n=1 Tax=Nelumbo nucifera TaxID=4432 RepID=A0A822YD48_NELNU|nr:TPA_asm: hypothetical protein HUJ06_009351 [Nelumbo nucifera]
MCIPCILLTWRGPLFCRYQNAPSGVKRCLKLSMTDGSQRVFGMEYRPIKDLEVLSPAGFKVVIRNVNIRRGLLMLVPEVLEVLGGLVENLDVARQRLVNEVNKPPRGKRTRTGAVPSLATRATLAAWPSNNVNEPGHATNSASRVATSRTSQQGDALSVPSSVGRESTREESSAPHGRPIVVESSSPPDAVLSVHTSVTREGTTEDFAALVVPNSITRENSVEEFPPPDRSPDAISIQSQNVVSCNEGIHTVCQEEHPVILTGDREVPFTYLASLLAKWAARDVEAFFVQGKIKCFLTGVKRFQFKQRSAFELLVYVDDGSLISEILVDHSVVQKGIGHSPEEVTTALSSSDNKIVNDMKETMKRYQLFLSKFEGTMLVEINKTSPLPVVLEMNQGCSESDAWLLLRRLKTSATPQTPRYPRSDPINLSP